MDDNNNKVTNFINTFIGGLILVLLAGLLLYSFNYIKKPVIISQEEALGETGPVLSMVPSMVGTRINEPISVNVQINTNTETVSGANLVINYDAGLLTANSVVFPADAFLPVKFVPPVIGNGKITMTLGCDPSTPNRLLPLHSGSQHRRW